MKKILFTITFVVVCYLAKAQETFPGLEKGKFMIETSLSPFSLAQTTGFGFASNDGVSEWNVGGEAGYFVEDKLAIKLGLGIAGVSYDGDSETALSYKVGVKYYVANSFPFQIDLGGLNSGGEDSFIFGGQVGYAWFLRDNIAIEPGVRYDHGLNDNASGVKTFSAKLGFSLHF